MHIRQGTATFDRYCIVDAASGQEIADVIEADDQAGWYRMLRKHGNGRPVLTESGEQKRVKRHGSIRIERREEPPPQPHRRARAEPSTE